MLRYPELNISITPAAGSGRGTVDDVVMFTAAGREHILENNLSHQPAGIKCLAATLGIKKSGSPDFTFVMLGESAKAAAVFTRSLCPSVTILRNRKLLSGGFRALAVNSGNANVYTPSGEKDLSRIAELLSAEFGIPADKVLISSTGIIGVSLPMEKFEKGIPGTKSALKEGALEQTAKAILTTDFGPKTASIKSGELIVCGMAKGAGMIEPNMATLLVYIFTNAKLGASAMQKSLSSAADVSFNSISIDTDMSTSDTLAMFSTEEVPIDAEQTEIFHAAVQAICVKLARDVVSQGEGVSKLVECAVSTGISAEFAKSTAKRIINSPLVKAAAHGADPNWGRIVAAIGKGDGAEVLDPKKIRIVMQGTPVYDRGNEVNVDVSALSKQLKDSPLLNLEIDIAGKDFFARTWGCDLTEEYVTFNSDYAS